MSNAMRKMYSMALMAAAMSGGLGGGMPGFGMNGDNQDERKRPMPKFTKPKLSGVNHIGSIPKGCQVQKAEVIARKENYHISIIVEIVAMTKKAFNQKLVAKKNEISTYISFTPIAELLLDNRFLLTAMPDEVVNEGSEG